MNEDTYNVICDVKNSNRSNRILLSRSPRQSLFWTLSCGAEERTPSSDRPESAVSQGCQQRAAAMETHEKIEGVMREYFHILEKGTFLKLCCSRFESLQIDLH